jgi:hypothetical protein
VNTPKDDTGGVFFPGFFDFNARVFGACESGKDITLQLWKPAENTFQGNRFGA